MKKEERSFVGSMTEKQVMWNRRAWKVMFLVGLFLIPTAIFLSMTYYPGAGLPHDWLVMPYWGGFCALTISVAQITRKEKIVGIISIACAAVIFALIYALHSITVVPETLSAAGSAILCGGIFTLAEVMLRPLQKGGGGKHTRELPKPPIQRLSREFKGLACAALLLVACVPGTCFGVTAASGRGASVQANSTNMIKVGETTIEIISNTSIKISDISTVLMLEFIDSTHIVMNGTMIELPRPKPSVKVANPPVGANGIFWWDGLQFASGQYIRYPHPDRDHYDISPYTEWSKYGSQLFHSQLDDQMSGTLVRSALPVVVSLLGALIGTLVIGPPHGALIGGIVGAVFGVYLYWVGYDLLDEKGCVWWWCSSSFNQWLVDNTLVLVALYIISPPLAVAMAASAFASCGYLSMGKVLYFDALGVGRPAPPNLDIPKPGTPAFHLRFPGGSRTCLMR